MLLLKTSNGTTLLGKMACKLAFLYYVFIDLKLNLKK